MNPELDKLRRRPFFFPLVVPVLVFLGLARPFFFPLVVPVLVFLGLVVAAAWLFDARATTVVFVVRHAETETSADADPGLAVDGRERAARLAKMLAQARPVRGLDAIFASELRRTQQTVAPVAEQLALPVNVIPSGAWPELATKVKREHRGEFVLAAGHSNTVPVLIEALSGEKVSVRDDEYDAMFIVFVPQLSKSKVVRVRY